MTAEGCVSNQGSRHRKLPKWAFRSADVSPTPSRASPVRGEGQGLVNTVEDSGQVRENILSTKNETRHRHSLANEMKKENAQEPFKRKSQTCSMFLWFSSPSGSGLQSKNVENRYLFSMCAGAQ